MPRASDAAARRPYHDGPRLPVPPRKTLPHHLPSFVDPAKEIFFITVCCQLCGRNQLAIPVVGPPLIATIEHRNENHIWWAHLAVIMPDHVQFLLFFPRERPFKITMSKCKEWTAKSLHIEWQRDFFDHRLRREESNREKADYILRNPVRAESWEDWPYLFVAR